MAEPSAPRAFPCVRGVRTRRRLLCRPPAQPPCRRAAVSSRSSPVRRVRESMRAASCRCPDGRCGRTAVSGATRRAASSAARAWRNWSSGRPRGGQAGEGGDLTGQRAQVGGVLTGPGGDGAIGRAPVPGGLDPLLPGGAERAGAQPQIAALGRLPTGDTERVSQLRPTGPRRPGGLDQPGLPPGEPLPQLAQQLERGQGLSPVRIGRRAVGLLGRGGPGVADRVVDDAQRRRGGEEGDGVRIGVAGGVGLLRCWHGDSFDRCGFDRFDVVSSFR